MKILIVEVNWLGDVLFSTAAIRALRRRFPESFISCLVVPRVREVLEDNPNINEIIINDEDGPHKGLGGSLRLTGQLRDAGFDLAVLFHRSFSRTALACLSGIPGRIGYSTWKRRFLLTQAVPMPEKDSLHRVDYYLGIVKALGCDVSERSYDFFLTRQDAEFAEEFFRKEGINKSDFTVCLNPGGNWYPKRWPKESFAILADSLIMEYGMKVIFSGSPGDVGLVDRISAKMKEKPVIAVGKTTLKQSATIFKKANLVISADSGPLHIAAAVGANVIALFGPTDAAITGPIGKGKISVIQKPIECVVPCYDANCNDNRCMGEITVSDVIEEVNKYLGRV